MPSLSFGDGFLNEFGINHLWYYWGWLMALGHWVYHLVIAPLISPWKLRPIVADAFMLARSENLPHPARFLAETIMEVNSGFSSHVGDGISLPVGSMYGIYANIGGILMVNVTIYSSTMDPMGYVNPHYVKDNDMPIFHHQSRWISWNPIVQELVHFYRGESKMHLQSWRP